MSAHPYQRIFPFRASMVVIMGACIGIACDSGPTEPENALCLYPTPNLVSYSLGSGPAEVQGAVSTVVASGTEGNWDSEVRILDMGPEDVEVDLAQLILYLEPSFLDDTVAAGPLCRGRVSFGQYSTTDVAVGTSEELNAKYYETVFDQFNGDVTWPPGEGSPAAMDFDVMLRQVSDPVLGIPDGPVIRVAGEARFR